MWISVPETKDEPTETVTDSAASGDSENERKQAGFDFPANLAPKQRELFMRIHQQQREANEDEPVQTSDDKGKPAMIKGQIETTNICRNIVCGKEYTVD